MTQNWNVFIWKTDVFLFYAVVFCAVSLRIVFQTFIPEIALFSRKTYQSCHCEKGACARRGNL